MASAKVGLPPTAADLRTTQDGPQSTDCVEKVDRSVGAVIDAK